MPNNFLHGKDGIIKAAKNQQLILNFLYKEKYTTAKILQELLQYQSPQSARRVLRKMVENGFLIKHRYSGVLTLWGITNKGLSGIHLKKGQVFEWRYFDPSKIRIALLDHQLDVQHIHVQCINSGLDFTSGSELGSREYIDKVPDGIIHTTQGNIAIEVERNLKSRKRYDAIVYNYLQAIKAGKYRKILYVSHTEELKETIENAITGLKHVTIHTGSQTIKHPLEKKHLDYFGFVTFKTLTPILQRLSAGAKND